MVEFPETAEQEEMQREEEMESLYQIRRARREERAAREEQRRLRAEARARGDTATLEELRREARQSTADARASAAALSTLHNQQERGRNFSAVDYGDLGVARHDGSRVRAGSSTSRRPLLTAGAAVGVSDALPPPGLGRHLRNQSSSSLRFMTPDMSDDDDDSTSRGPSLDAESVLRPWVSRGRSASQLSVDTSEAAEGLLSETEPPHYSHLGWNDERGEAPPYSPITSSGAPRIPAFAPLPSIEIIASSPVLASTRDTAEDSARFRSGM